MTIQDLYTQWCTETKRNGSTLVGGSIREFFTWLDDKGFKLINTNFILRTDVEVKAAQIKGYTYILP